MAKPTKYATPISLVLTLLVLIGIIWGFLSHNPLIVTGFLLPAVIYEVYRTEGESTRWSSWAMLVVIVLEFVFIIFKVNFNLATYLNQSEAYVAGYYVPLGDIKVIFPVIMAVLSLILLFRTRGKYTKWLAVLILISAVAIVYLIDPSIFKAILQTGVSRGIY